MPISLNITRAAQVYKDAIDALLQPDGMRKVVRLYFKKVITVPENQKFDDKIHSSSRKPSYKSSESIESWETKDIDALIEWTNQPYRDFGVKNIQDGTGTVRLKTFIGDLPDILRCHHMVPNFASRQYHLNSKYKLLGAPAPVGIQNDSYADSFWVKL